MTLSAFGRPVGAPRSGLPVDELQTPELLFARKYTGVDQFQYDGREVRCENAATAAHATPGSGLCRPGARRSGSSGTAWLRDSRRRT
jgi:hypothetical protein